MGVKQNTLNIRTASQTNCVGGRHNMPPPLQVDLLTLEGVSKSCVTWAASVPILAFLGLCSRVRPDVCNRQTRQTDIRQKHRLMPPPYGAE